MPRNSNRLCLAAMMVMMVCSGLALAQDEVFFTGPSNTIQRADWAASKATAVVTSKGSSFKGMAVREDGLIVVANATKNSSVMACDPVAKTCQNIIALAKAAAVTLSNRGDFFAVNSSLGGPNLVMAVKRHFGCGTNTCLPGGYDPDGVTVRQITTVGGLAIQQLVDIKFARFESGNVENKAVLVLSQRPAMIFSLPEDLTGIPKMVVSNNQFGPGLTPNGFELGAAGTILVTTKQKVIAQFDTSGIRLANFVAPLPGLGINLAAGLEVVASTPAARLYATIRDSSQVLRFNESGVVTGQITMGINPPYGIATPSTNSFAPTPADFNVGVSTSSLNTTWEQVNIAGFSSALCTDFADPRENPFVDSNLVVCVEPDGDLQLGLTDFACTPGTKRIIPSFMRGWRRVGPGDDVDDSAFPSREEPPVFPGPSGPFTIRLCQVDYSAPGGFEGLIVDESIEETWLGYDPGHPGGSVDHVCVGGPRSFYATSDGEPQLKEHPHFADVAISCGINLSGSWGRSFLLPTVRDLREIDTDDFVIDADASPAPGFCDPGAGSLDCKLAALLTLANVDLEGDDEISTDECNAGDGPCCVGDDDLRVELATRLVEARLAVDQARRLSPTDPPCTEDYEAAEVALESFVAAIEAAGAASFDDCEIQFEAQLRARAMSANFLLHTLLEETETEVCGAP